MSPESHKTQVDRKRFTISFKFQLILGHDLWVLDEI
jgi:hypothetical protein